jgi:hypothetical protein
MWPGLQFTRSDYLSLVLIPVRICWTIADEMASAKSSLVMVQMTPSQLVSKPPRDSKRPASSDFTLGKRKSLLGRCPTIRAPFAMRGSWTEVEVRTWWVIPIQQPVLGWQSGTFRLEIHQNFTRAFLMDAALMVSLPVFLNCDREGVQIGVPSGECGVLFLSYLTFLSQMRVESGDQAVVLL